MSRLLEGSEETRQNLEARNLYTPNDPYHLDNRQVVNTVNTLASLIKPFSSFDLSNTVFYRLIGPNTPIAQIGLAMLGKQMAFNIASNVGQEFLPSINFSNLFDGDPSSKLFTNKVDFQITRSRTRKDVFEVIDDLVGRTPPISPLTRVGRREYKFNTKENIEKTGKGVLQSLSDQVNMNFYKNNDAIFQIEMDRRDFALENSSNLVREKYLVTQDRDLYAFDQYKTPTWNSANIDYINSLKDYFKNPTDDFNGLNKVATYGSSQQFIDDLGTTQIVDNSDGAARYEINSSDYGIDDTPINKLVWGRDGTTSEYDEDVAGLTEVTPEQAGLENDTRFTSGGAYEDRDRFASFNIKNGLLNYTRQLLNSKGRYGSFDLTRKKFEDTDGNVHFNGSPLDVHPDGQTRDYSRRHSMVDPYDRFAKAIRFNGNKIYNGGNENSVIYDSVLPKIHPVISGERVDVSNMMFSIENLALQINENNELNDSFNTVLPACERGNNGGRLMWFPPYDMRLSEQSIARWENTAFIGRGEPIYTYNNSERMANLSFKLLMDYPPQLLNYTNREDFHKVAAEFFAFGGDGTVKSQPNPSKLQKELQDKIIQRDAITEKEELVDPELPFLDEQEFFFPNDTPKAGNPAGTGVEYVQGLGYENGIDLNDCGGDESLNVNFNVFIDDLITQFLNPKPNNAQLNDETYANIDFVNIELIGYATKLYEINPSLPNSERRAAEQSYNEELSQRRIDAVKDYINERFRALFSTSRNIESYKVKFIENALGSTTSSDENSSEDQICSIGAKRERRVTVRFVHNGNKLSKTTPLTPNQKVNIEKLNEDIRAIRQKINKAKISDAAISPCVYTKQEIANGYEKGFRSIHKNKFYPTFHSQTPEDFHKRLTFLQQCVRQGPAIRKQRSDGSLSAKNSVFGRQPVCILRIGDFFHTRIVIDNISFQYEETTWDTNPEGMGMQPMIADITMQMKIIGGQSLKAPIEAIQNAASFNYYANSTFYNQGVYATATKVESLQTSEDTGADTKLSNDSKKNDSKENISEANKKTGES